MHIIQKIKGIVGVPQGGNPTRGPIVQEGFLQIKYILHKYVLVSHITLNNMFETLHLVEIEPSDRLILLTTINN